MQKKKPNPSHNPVIQALQDMKAEGMDVNDLIKQLESDKPLANRVAERFDRHQYPNRALKYTQIRNFNECRALTTIVTLKGGHSALELFLLICRIIGQELTFQLSTSGFMEFTKFSNKTIVNSIKLLKSYGFIATVKESVGKSPAIYMVNPCIANVGKPKNCEEFDKLAGDFALAKLKRLNEINDNVRIEHRSYVDIIGSKLIKYTTLVEVHNKEKESSTSDNSDIETLFENGEKKAELPGNSSANK